jgi:hypothetical protein
MLYVFDLLVEKISVITHQHLAILVMRIVNCTAELVHEVGARQQDLWFLTSFTRWYSPGRIVKSASDRSIAKRLCVGVPLGTATIDPKFDIQ